MVNKVVASDGRSIPIGSILDKASRLPFPLNAKLKTDNFRVVGKSLPRTDLCEKINGSTQYGIDIKIPDMVHSFVVRCPQHKGKMKSYDASQVLNQPGVIKVIPISLGVAVVAKKR